MGRSRKKPQSGPTHPDMLVPVTFQQEKYNPKSGHFNICYEKVNKVKVKDIKIMIRNEVFAWATYDECSQQEVAKAEKARLKPRRSAKCHLPFTGIRPKKARDSTGPEAEASTGPKTSTGPKASTGPKVRVVTKLSKLKRIRGALNKQISKGCGPATNWRRTKSC